MFLKFLKFFIPTTIFLVAFFISVFLPLRVFAEVSKLVFTTEPQTLGVGQISGPITIQVQDQSGSETKATETIYLNFTSSINGEFSSNKDTWKSLLVLPSDFSTSSVYISTNSANRTFYYKGLLEGVHQITIYAKSKSGRVFDSITQNIIIGGEATTTPIDSGGATTTPHNATTSDQTVIYKTVIRYVSTHSNPEDLSDYNGVLPIFEVSAGRERLSYVGVPLQFVAKYKDSNNSSSKIFTWSFGDGLSAEGYEVSHSFKFPGEYLVVLNGKNGDLNSVSRTIVKILTPKISIVVNKDGIEISNDGDFEINLGKWEIKSNIGRFVLAEDTIIGAKKKIILSRDLLKISSESLGKVSLVNPSQNEIAYYQANPISISTNQTSENITLSDSREMTSLEKERFIAEYNRITQIQKHSVSEESVAKLTQKDIIYSNQGEETDIINQTAVVSESVGTSTSEGFWRHLFGLPGRGIKAVASIFYDF